MTAPLTDRQQQIRDLLLDEGMSAPDVAEKLGISRNAVYQHIQALRNKGALPDGWTPTGETRIPAGARSQEIMSDLTQGLKVRGAPADGARGDGALDVIASLVDMNKALIETNERLTRIVESITSQSTS